MGVKLRILLMLCWIGMVHGVHGQGQRVLNGRKYTIHMVQAGQTLYAIARTHAVPLELLLAANPTAQDGLSIGEEVLIPLDAVVRKELKSAPQLRNGELVHTVRKKETLFGISRRYGVHIDRVLERNPAAIALHEGMELVIPLAEVANTPASALAPAGKAGGLSHVVQAGETLFGLGQRYAVDPEAIKAANGGLLEGLKTGATIRIPEEPRSEGAPPPKVRLREQVRYKVGLMLPFSIDRNDSVLAQGKAQDGSGYYERTVIATQFYQGARLAIDSLRKLGLHADIDVVDMGDDITTWGAVIKQPSIQEYDLFIGPFHRSAIEQLARANPHAHIVCPVPQSNKVILGNPQVSKVSPTRSDLVKHAGRFVANKYPSANIIVLKPEIAAEKEAQEQVRAALNAALAQRTDRLRDSVLVAKPGRRELGDLPGKLDASRLNVILAPSEDVEFVTMLVSKLKPLAAKYKIRLVGMESWYSMPSVDLNDLEVLDHTYAAPAFFDQEDPRIRAFASAFQERTQTAVDEYALLGFDITFYYLKALYTQGLTFPEHFDQVHTEPLHMGFRMSRTGAENGFRNEYAIMLEQEDLRLIKVQ